MFPEEGQAIVAKILLLLFAAFTMCFARARAQSVPVNYSHPVSVESVQF